MEKSSCDVKSLVITIVRNLTRGPHQEIAKCEVLWPFLAHSSKLPQLQVFMKEMKYLAFGGSFPQGSELGRILTFYMCLESN